MASDSWSIFVLLICLGCLFTAEAKVAKVAHEQSKVGTAPKVNCHLICPEWPSLSGKTYDCTITYGYNRVQFVVRAIEFFNWQFYLVPPDTDRDHICSIAKRGDEFRENPDGDVCGQTRRFRGSRSIDSFYRAATEAAPAADKAASAAPTVAAPAAPKPVAAAPPAAPAPGPLKQPGPSASSGESKIPGGGMMFSNVLSSIANAKVVKPLDILKNVTGVAKDIMQGQKPGEPQVMRRSDFPFMRDSLIEPLINAIRSLLSAFISEELTARRDMMSGSEMRSSKAQTLSTDLSIKSYYVCRIFKEYMCLEEKVIKCSGSGRCCYQPLRPTSCFVSGDCDQNFYDTIRGVRF